MGRAFHRNVLRCLHCKQDTAHWKQRAWINGQSILAHLLGVACTCGLWLLVIPLFLVPAAVRDLRRCWRCETCGTVFNDRRTPRAFTAPPIETVQSCELACVTCGSKNEHIGTIAPQYSPSTLGRASRAGELWVRYVHFPLLFGGAVHLVEKAEEAAIYRCAQCGTARRYIASPFQSSTRHLKVAPLSCPCGHRWALRNAIVGDSTECPLCRQTHWIPDPDRMRGGA